MKKLVFLLISFLLILGCATGNKKPILVEERIIINKIVKEAKPQPKPKPKAEELPKHIKKLIDVVNKFAIKKYWWKKGYYSGLFEFDAIEVKSFSWQILLKIMTKEENNNTPLPSKKIEELPPNMKKLIDNIKLYVELRRQKDNDGVQKIRKDIRKKGGLFDKVVEEAIKNTKKDKLEEEKPSKKKKYNLPLHIATLINLVEEASKEKVWQIQGCKNTFNNLNIRKESQYNLLKDIISAESEEKTPVKELDVLHKDLKELIFAVQKLANIHKPYMEHHFEYKYFSWCSNYSIECHEYVNMASDYRCQMSKIASHAGLFDKVVYIEATLQAEKLGIELPKKTKKPSPKNQCPAIRKIVE